MLVLLLVSAFYLALSKEAAYHLLACYSATLVSLFLCEIVCRFTMYGTDLMMLLNIVLRGVAIYSVTIPVSGITCVEPFFKVVTYYINPLVTLSDFIILRTNT